MRFICLYKSDPSVVLGPEKFAALEKLIEEQTAAGVLVATEGFHPNADDVRVRIKDGEFTVTDGPFTEAKEIIGGFAILEAKSKEECIEHCKAFLRVMGQGENEIHPLPAR
ncbi:MAG TPA: YciI family protein [Polyangiaceae bacterium]|jgi:hypothetical protein|nr:YciI family protein [Polyangiaceae bacterium]